MDLPIAIGLRKRPKYHSTVAGGVVQTNDVLHCFAHLMTSYDREIVVSLSMNIPRSELSMSLIDPN
jgi:hypothetical protein